jgi:glycosyltransferase involved in cell wall biosynthesis
MASAVGNTGSRGDRQVPAHAGAEPRTLVYVLNSYSAREASHFAHTLPLLRAIADRGMDVHLLIEKADGLPEPMHPRLHVRGMRLRTPGLRHLELLWHLLGLVRRGEVRVFCRIAMPATLCALLACIGSPARVFYWQSGTVHAFDREQPFGIAKLRHFLGVRLPFMLVRRFVHGFVTGPETMVRYYRDEVGVAAAKLRLLYNDISLARFGSLQGASATAAARHALGLAPDTLVLLFVHRLSPVRRTMLYVPALFDWLAAFHARPVVLLVAGGGDELPAVRAAAESRGLGDRIRILGSLPNAELDRLYAAADLFLHPTYNEGFPRVVIEAMAAGLPIVTTDAGGTLDIVGPEQVAFVTARDDPGAFVARLDTLARDDGLRARVAAENREHVQRFDTPRVAAMYEEVLFA